jgi:tetratricopeptide (TPR) repeat protein
MLAGKTEAAAAAFEEAVQLRPQHMETNVLAAQFHISQGDTATAKVLLTSNWAVAVNREDGIQFDDQYWYVMARCHMLSGAKGKAIEAIESALELRPSKIIYHSFQSDVLRHLGKGAEAARVSETVGRLSIARRRLFLIDQELKLDRPDPKQCSDIAELMDQLNNPLEARQWRQVALIDQGGTR